MYTKGVEEREREPYDYYTGRTAAALNFCYRKSAALALILSQETSKQLASPMMTGDDPR